MAPGFAASMLPRRAVMGVVNVTPDSFSDGGRFLDHEGAIRHGLMLADRGASILDVGGESTRPGAAPVDDAEELRRVIPVVAALAAQTSLPVSIDTTKAAVARAALESGASIVNDVSAGTFDPDILRVAAEHDAGFVVMHMRGVPRTMQDEPRYDDVVQEVGDYLRARVDAVVAAGITRDAVFGDPGIGFGKTADHNLALLAALPEVRRRASVPLVVGASRKSFIGRTLGNLPVQEREEGTLATSVWCFAQGVAVVRVHDVEVSARVACLLDILDRASPEGIAA